MFGSVDGWRVVCRYTQEEFVELAYLWGPGFRLDVYSDTADVPEDKKDKDSGWTMHESFLRSWQGNGDVARLMKTLKPGETLAKAWKAPGAKESSE